MSMRKSSLNRTFRIATLGGILAGLVMAAPANAGVENYVFVPNRASSDVAVIDTRTDEVIAHVKVGHVPHQVVVSTALGTMVTSNTEDNTITFADLKTLAATATLRLDIEPEHMELSPNGALVAIGNIGAGTVSLVSLAERKELSRVTGLIQPHNMTFSRDGTRLFVANLGANHVSVVDVAKAIVIDEIGVAEPTPLASKSRDSGAEFQGIINVTATPDGRLGFAAHGEGNTMAVIDLDLGKKIKDVTLGELPWRAFATADGRYMLVPNNGDKTVSVISTATQEVVATLPGGEDMTGINTAVLDTTAFVISRGEDKVIVLDLIKMEPAGEIALPGTPETAVTTPNGMKIYVALSDANKVAVIDAHGRKLIKMIEGVGEEPWGVTMVGALNYCH